MIQLVKYFLTKAPLKFALIFCSIIVAAILGSSRFCPSGNQPIRFMIFMWVGMGGMIMTRQIVESEEFDLLLPVRRRKFHLAQSVASLLYMAILVVPFSAAAWAVGVFHGGRGEALMAAATFALCLISLPLMVIPLMRLAARMRSPLTMTMVGTVPLIVIMPLMMLALEGRNSIFVPAVVAVPAAALAWFWGRRQFERYELAPNCDTSSSQVAVVGSSLADGFSPVVRVLAHGVWLKGWYPLLVVFVAGIGFMFTSMTMNMAGFLILSCLAYLGFGGLIFILFKEAAMALLPFVQRRTILRSVLGPIAATPLLIGCVAAIATDSAQMIVRGLVTALMIVGMTWFILPSAKEYHRPLLAWLRVYLVMILVICFLACVLVPAIRDFIGRPLATSWSCFAPWFGGNQFLISCVIVLAIALLWWRCERKFRHFEPLAMPSSFRNAA